MKDFEEVEAGGFIYTIDNNKESHLKDYTEALKEKNEGEYLKNIKS